MAQTHTIAPPTLNIFVYLGRIFRARRYYPLLCRKFVRELTRQTVLGWWWMIFRAVIPTLGLIVVFQNFSELQSTEIPYGIHMIGGMTLWTIVSSGMVRSARSLMQAKRLLIMHQFPRMIAALSGLVLPAVFLAVFLVVAGGLLILYWATDGVFYLRFGWEMLIAPLIVVLVFMLVSGIISVLSVIFLMARDVRFGMPVVIQIWFLATPILYPISLVPEPWPEIILYLNPMAALVETFRWSLFGVESMVFPYVFVAAGLAVATFLFGLWFVMRSEVVMEDIY